MENIGKALGTAAVWGGAIGLSYLFHSFGIFDSDGAVGMVVVAAVLTAGIWGLN